MDFVKIILFYVTQVPTRSQSGPTPALYILITHEWVLILVTAKDEALGCHPEQFGSEHTLDDYQRIAGVRNQHYCYLVILHICWKRKTSQGLAYASHQRFTELDAYSQQDDPYAHTAKQPVSGSTRALGEYRLGYQPQLQPGFQGDPNYGGKQPAGPVSRSTITRESRLPQARPSRAMSPASHFAFSTSPPPRANSTPPANLGATSTVRNKQIVNTEPYDYENMHINFGNLSIEDKVWIIAWSLLPSSHSTNIFPDGQ